MIYTVAVAFMTALAYLPLVLPCSAGGRGFKMRAPFPTVLLFLDVYANKWGRFEEARSDTRAITLSARKGGTYSYLPVCGRLAVCQCVWVMGWHLAVPDGQVERRDVELH